MISLNSIPAVKLGGDRCSETDICSTNMACISQKCLCTQGELTPDRRHCKRPNDKLLGESCHPSWDTCFQISGTLVLMLSMFNANSTPIHVASGTYFCTQSIIFFYHLMALQGPPTHNVWTIRGRSFFHMFFPKWAMFSCGWVGSGQVAVHLKNEKKYVHPKIMVGCHGVYIFSPGYVLLRGWVGGSASNRTLFVWEKPYTKMDDPFGIFCLPVTLFLYRVVWKKKYQVT